MKRFNIPSMAIIPLANEDIVTTSPCDTYCASVCPRYTCPDCWPDCKTHVCLDVDCPSYVP